MDKVVLGTRIIDCSTGDVLDSFEGIHWHRDFNLIYNTYYKNNLDKKVCFHVLTNTFNIWLNDDSVLDTVNSM